MFASCVWLNEVHLQAIKELNEQEKQAQAQKAAAAAAAAAQQVDQN